MKSFMLLALSIISLTANAHNMGRDIKIKQIKKAIYPLGKETSRNDFEISANPFSLNYSFQELRLHSGDHDIDHITIQLDIQNTPHEIECDMMTIEIAGKPYSYIMAFEECTLLNLENFNEMEFTIQTQRWDDFQY